MITKTFDMRLIRYMNIFSRITRISAKHCFLYNNMIVFVVPAFLVNKAIGHENSNLKKISEIIGRKIRVVAEPRGIQDAEKFVSVIVSPAKFTNIQFNDKEAVITTSGMENKALIIGRNKARFMELKEILEQYFGMKSLKIL